MMNDCRSLRGLWSCTPTNLGFRSLHPGFMLSPRFAGLNPPPSDLRPRYRPSHTCSGRPDVCPDGCHTCLGRYHADPSGDRVRPGGRDNCLGDRDTYLGGHHTYLGRYHAHPGSDHIRSSNYDLCFGMCSTLRERNGRLVGMDAPFLLIGARSKEICQQMRTFRIIRAVTVLLLVPTSTGMTARHSSH